MFHILHLTVISNHLRLDKGTETGHMATIHAFLRQHHGEGDNVNGEDTVHDGPSTHNKVYIATQYSNNINAGPLYTSPCLRDRTVTRMPSSS